MGHIESVGTPARFTYDRWRHGGWYVLEVRYPSGAVGCVSRNFPDRKWRIVCDPRPNAYERFTYPNRDDAARAEWALVQELHREIGPGLDTAAARA